MKKTCNPELSTCCALAAYWRELSYAEQARADRACADRDSLQHIVDHLRLALRAREAEIASLNASMAKRKNPVASEYGYREVRRRA